MRYRPAMANPQPIQRAPDDDAQADAEALADLKAGRTVSHEAVKAWLQSWGTVDELPPPETAAD